MTLIETEALGPVTRLTLNAPERLNPLSDAMMAALHGALGGLAEDEDCHAVILAGAGRAFCAGHDLKEMQAARQAEDGGAGAFRDLFAP